MAQIEVQYIPQNLSILDIPVRVYNGWGEIEFCSHAMSETVNNDVPYMTLDGVRSYSTEEQYCGGCDSYYNQWTGEWERYL